MAEHAPRYTRLPRRGPGTQMVTLVALAAVTSALAVAAMAVHVAYSQLRDSVHETQPVGLEWSRERLEARVAELPSQLARLVESESFRSWVAPASGSAPLSAESPERDPAFSGLIVLDREGAILRRQGARPEVDQLASLLDDQEVVGSELLELMQAAQLREELASVEAPSLRVVDTGGPHPNLVASAPLRDRSGRSTGTVHAVVRREDLARQMRADLLGGGAIYLTDEDGNVIAASGEGSDRGETRIAPRLRSASERPEVVLLWAGVPTMVVTSAAPAGVFDWTLVARETPTAATSRMFVAFLQIGAVAAVAVGLFTFWAAVRARATTRPLQSLFEALQRVASGDLRVELAEARVRGQVAALFRAFNAATARQREKQSRNDANLRSLVEQNMAFQKQNDMLSTLSVTDGLTGLHNHRYFTEQVNREIKRQLRTREDMTLLIIDIDDFKKLNDQFGHAAGDQFLKQLARILEEIVRDTDVLVRYGGEEFLVLATGTDLTGAVTLAEKIRTQVAETSFIVDSSMRPRRVTVSIGVSKFKNSQSEMFTSADAALYRAKASGKNCVVASEDDGSLSG